jgi:signal peptidase I
LNKLKRFNFRWAKHLFWIVLLAGLFFYLNSSAPFSAIPSESMVPTLARGDLVFTESIAPNRIQVGDIIVYKVPAIFQMKYGYPTKVCHRVVKIENIKGVLNFRTKGDAAGEDPFMVLPQDIVGKETRSISCLGYLVMFPQSSQGWYFLIGLAFLYLFYVNSAYIFKSTRNLRYAFFGVSANEYINSQHEMEKKINLVNSRVAESMNAFASSMAEYAKHLQSHTSAVKSLAQAAEHLESILPSKLEMAVRKSDPLKVVVEDHKEPADEAPRREAFTAIEVTPELRTAVKAFITDYLKTNNLTHLEMTPELRKAVWDFINAYVKTKKETGLERSLIKLE